MFDLIRERRATAIEQAKLKTMEARGTRRYLEAVLSDTDKYKDPFQDSDESQWQLVDAGERAEKRKKLVEQSGKLFDQSPYGRNAIRLVMKYAVGRGFDIKPRENLEAAEDWWTQFWNLNRMNLRRKEIARRALRDGETFLRWFPGEDGIPLGRFCRVGDIAWQEGMAPPPADTKVEDGVAVSEEDAEEAVAYCYRGQWVAAEEIDHLKIGVDMDVPRGQGYLQVVAQYCAMHYGWLQDRVKLNKLRTTVGLVRQVTGSPGKTAAIKSGTDTKNLRTPDGSAKFQMPESVSVFTTNKGVDYDFKTPNLQAADVANDGRAILLAIAAGVGVPEFMLSSDASNNNYASALVAEAPGVMEFMDWQDTFADYFQRIHKRVIEAGIAVGRIPAEVTEDVIYDDGTKGKETRPVHTDANIVFPEVTHRDFLKEVQGYEKLWGMGIASKETTSTHVGLDYDAEQEKIKHELEEEAAERGEPEPDFPPVGSEDEDETEEEV